MPGTQPRRTFPQRLGSSVKRRASVGTGTPGVGRVQRVTDTGVADSTETWVVVEPAASIAAKGYAYISFDPA